MAAHRFKLELGGQVVYGIAFESAEALEQYMACRGLPLFNVQTFAQTAPPAAVVDDEQRPRGRPSFDTAIAAAVSAIDTQLAACDSLSARARLVLRHMAQSHSVEDLPDTRTVTRFFTEHARQKYGQKFRQKSKRATIHRNGGI